METNTTLGRITLGPAHAGPALTIPSTPYQVTPPPNLLVPKANDTQVGGRHYKGKAIQPWDYIVDNGMGYLAGNVVKYASRYKDKNGIDDLKKAMHYLEKLIEVEGGSK